MSTAANDKSLGRWMEAGLGFFYPELCQICEKTRATAAEGYVCGGCADRAELIQSPFCARCGMPAEGEITQDFECAQCRESPPSFAFARAGVRTSDFALLLVHRYKYQRALWFEPFLARWLIQAYRLVPGAQTWDAAVPVPLHPVKQREREFNQAERLARRLGGALKIPVNARLVQRVKYTRTQTLLSRHERAENLRGAFAPRKKAELHGERIILVDDVFTTGATTHECAKVLKKMGAGEVCVLTVLRGI